MSEFEKDKNEEHKFGETARKIGETPTEGDAPANEPLNADIPPPEATEKPSVAETPTAGNESGACGDRHTQRALFGDSGWQRQLCACHLGRAF